MKSLLIPQKQAIEMIHISPGLDSLIKKIFFLFQYYTRRNLWKSWFFCLEIQFRSTFLAYSVHNDGFRISKPKNNRT